MNSRWLFLLFALFATPALAEPITLTINEAGAVSQGLAAMARGEQKVVKDGEKQTVVTVPAYLSPAVRIAIGKDIARIEVVLKPVREEIAAMVRACGDKCEGAGKAKLDEQVAAEGLKTVTMDLVTFTVPELQLDRNVAITPDMLRAAGPVLPFMRETTK